MVFVTRFACSTIDPEERCTVSLNRSHGSIPEKRNKGKFWVTCPGPGVVFRQTLKIKIYIPNRTKG
jgi:hypothetical protein